MSNQIKDTDYLFLTTRVRALECSLLDREKMEQMLDAGSNEEAARVLVDCGYQELPVVNVDTVSEMLAAERDKTFREIYQFAPDPAIVDVFKVKYDYHNAKVMLKSEAMNVSSDRLLVDTGRVPAEMIAEAVQSSDFRGLPAILGGAMQEAREVLAATRDPQLSDFVLDNAYFQDMFQIAKDSRSSFLEGYVRVNIDAANIRSVVRTLRMGKGSEFLAGVIFRGGNVDASRILSVVTAGGSLEEIYGTSQFKDAAEAGAAAIRGGELTRFEKLCDDAVMQYAREAKFVAFGEAPVIAYLSAKDTELVTVRIIMTGRLAGLSADVIRERLRESYV